MFRALGAAVAFGFCAVAAGQESGESYERAIETPERDVFAPRVLPGAKRAQERMPPIADALANWPDLYRDENLTVTGSLTATLGLYKMWNNQFSSSDATLPAGISRNPAWGEWFVEPGLSARYRVNAAATLYGGFAFIESATRGRDYDGNDNIYHGLPELVYGGVTFKASEAWTIDLSYGQQDFMVGDGMLLWSGATDGVQRGAAFVMPRQAWANAAIAKATSRDLTVEAFYLKPNEAQAETTGTRIEGIDVRWSPAGPLHLSATYLHVPRSEIVTRDKLDVLDVRVRWHPLPAAPQFWLAGEFAWERGPNARASGGYVQANYNAQDLPWKPLVSLQWSSLSGDKPGSSRWEGFDPLYFGNTNPNWYPGTIASTLFDNTNLEVASLTLTLNPSEKQVLQLWLLDFRAAVANAPLAIPDPGEPVPVGGGVPSKPLAREIDVSWTYKFNNAVNVNALAAYALPGSGVKALYSSMDGTAAGWWFIGTQLNVSY